MSKYQEKLDEFASKVLNTIEEGTAPWQKPWDAGKLFELPKNHITGKEYRGANLLTTLSSGYNDPRWLSYNQAIELGGHVRKNENGTAGFFFSPTRLEKELDEKGKPVLDGSGKAALTEIDKPVFNTFTIFNGSQIKGLEKYNESTPSWEPEEKAENILAASGVKIVESQLDEAFYRPKTHTIETPAKAQFHSKSKYYSAMFHELAHATKNESMLGREAEYSSDAGKAKEELRAEISAWMICSQIGIGYEPKAIENNENYVAVWLSALDKKDRAYELGKAMNDAEQISEYILGLDPEKIIQQTKNKGVDNTQKVEKKQPQLQHQNRIYLNVPYKERQQAKKLGARWDVKEKSWFYTDPSTADDFSKWGLSHEKGTKQDGAYQIKGTLEGEDSSAEFV